MINRSEFKLDNKRREILPSYSEELPFSCIQATLDSFIGRGLHWHSALEIDYVIDGTIEYQIASRETVVLKKGDAIFINSNIMHSAKAAKRDSVGNIFAFLFGSHFLSGIIGGLLDQKYVLPLHQNPNVPFYVLHPDCPEHIHVLELLLRLPKLAEEEEYGYEFEMRSVLCRAWLILIKETDRIPCNKLKGGGREDSERLKKMAQYIQEHYMEKISLSQISAAAGLSERECTRCFRRNVHMTPILYLNHFRVRMAAQMLLHTNESIFSISELCGFNSCSYFGQVFREMTGKTPFAYRKSQG